MRRADADIWVLTETRRGLSPGPEYRPIAASTAGRDGKEIAGLADPDEVWVGIWSRLDGEVTPLTTIAPSRTAAARLVTGGRPLVVYGTVLPWSADTAGLGARGAEKFCLALEEQRRDWARLVEQNPGAELCVAGDFNQDLDTKHYYGSASGRAALASVFGETGLVCLTAGEWDPVKKVRADHASIDHICVTRGLVPQDGACVVAWPGRTDIGAPLSDHFGVMATLGV